MPEAAGSRGRRSGQGGAFVLMVPLYNEVRPKRMQEYLACLDRNRQNNAFGEELVWAPMANDTRYGYQGTAWTRLLIGGKLYGLSPTRIYLPETGTFTQEDVVALTAQRPVRTRKRGKAATEGGSRGSEPVQGRSPGSDGGAEDEERKGGGPPGCRARAGVRTTRPYHPNR